MVWKWTPKRRRAAELVALGEKTQQQIARDLGITDRALRMWQREPEFAAYVRDLERVIREDAKRYLSRRALHAARRLVELMDSGTRRDQVRLKATLEVLDRSGVTAVLKVASTDAEGNDLAELLKRLAEGDRDAAHP